MSDRNVAAWVDALPRYQLLAFLKLVGGRPRVHGNGFIQLDLSDRVRLHVWGDERIPRQAVETPKHNHTFGFTSFVLSGSLRNVMFRADEDVFMGDYQPYQATVRDREDTVLSPVGGLVKLVKVSDTIIRVGQSYHMGAWEIHESEPLGPSVSVIVKDGPSLAQGGPSPTVYVPVRAQPDNTFNRYATPPDVLWDIIADQLADVQRAAAAPEEHPQKTLTLPSIPEVLYILREEGHLRLSVADALLVVYRKSAGGSLAAARKAP